MFTSWLCDCMWVSFDPRERSMCGLATDGGGRAGCNGGRCFEVIQSFANYVDGTKTFWTDSTGYCVVLPIIKRHYDKRLVYLSRFLRQSPALVPRTSRLAAHPTPPRHETHISTASTQVWNLHNVRLYRLRISCHGRGGWVVLETNYLHVNLNLSEVIWRRCVTDLMKVVCLLLTFREMTTSARNEQTNERTNRRVMTTAPGAGNKTSSLADTRRRAGVHETHGYTDSEVHCSSSVYWCHALTH